MARGVVVVAVAASLGVIAPYYVRAISDLGRAAKRNAALSFADREIAGGNSVLVDQEAAYEARGLIPADSTYRVVVGSVRNETPLTRDFVDSWLRYFLMPRRPDPDARWTICYGCDTSQLRGDLDVRWHDDTGISIGLLR